MTAFPYSGNFVIVVLAVVVAAIVFSSSSSSSTPTISPSLPLTTNLVASYQSEYCDRLEVWDNSDLDIRVLRCDKVLLGGVSLQSDVDDEKHIPIFRVFYVVAAIVERVNKIHQRNNHKALLLGLGAGSVASLLQQQQPPIGVDIVEIDPQVIQATALDKHFYWKQHQHHQIFAEDAVVWLNAPAYADKRYHVIAHDAFTAGSAYTHLYNLQVFQNLKDHLVSNGGVLVVNFVGYHRGPHRFASYAVWRSLRAVFGNNVRCFRDEHPDVDPSQPSNLVFVAYSTSSSSLLDQQFATSDTTRNNGVALPEEYTPDWFQAKLLDWEVTFEESLTTSDDWRAPLLRNSADFKVFREHTGPVHEDIFLAIQDLLPWQVWSA